VFTISNSVRVVATFRDGHPVENLRQPTLAQAHQLAEEYGGEHCDFEYTTKGPDVPDAILAELVREHRARDVFRSVCQPDRPKPAMERKSTRAANAGRRTLRTLGSALEDWSTRFHDFILPDWYRNEHWEPVNYELA
jgi:hypothetical protein